MMNNLVPPTIDWLAVLPVMIVTITGLIALLVEMTWPKSNNNALVGVTLAGLAVAFGIDLIAIGLPARDSFAGMLTQDTFGASMQAILIVVAFLTALFSESYLREKRIAYGEFYALMAWASSGAMMMCETKSLAMVFIGLEVLSISLYVLAGMSRSEQKSEESAIKYFLLGAFASAFLLYGIAMVYGATGSIELVDVSRAWFADAIFMQKLLILGGALILIGLCFKASLVPFHMWAPDVYQGSPTNVTGYMAATAKIAAFAAMWRILDAFMPLHAYWAPALTVIAVLSMFGGNLLALVQKDVKRMLAYSSVSHAGYILVAILAHAADPSIGYGTLLYYLLSYSLMTVGIFAVVGLTANKGKEATTLDDLRGMAQRNPWAFGCLLVFVLSLVGLPPTAGFVGKLLIFNDAYQAGLPGLAIILAINSIISCGYYLAIAKAAWTPEGMREGNDVAKSSVAVRMTVFLCAAGIFAAVLFIGPLQASLLRR